MKIRFYICTIFIVVLFQSCLIPKGKVPENKTEKSTVKTVEWTVTFILNGELYQSYKVLDGGNVVPVNLVAEEKEFSGWYTDSSYTEVFDFEKSIDSDISIYGKMYRANAGIVLCFDDYYSNWDIIADRYSDKNVVFNFMISGALEEGNSLIKKIVENGHNLGNHTRSHTHLNYIELNQRNDFMETEIIKQKNAIENYCVVNDCFAFPFGAFDRDWELRLQRIFKKLRRFGTTNNIPFYYSNSSYVDKIIIASSSIDNIYFDDDMKFYEFCDSMIEELKKSKKTVVLTTHSIGEDDFAITLERLDYLVNEASKNKISFIRM